MTRTPHLPSRVTTNDTVSHLALLISSILTITACADDSHSHPVCATCAADEICVQKFGGACGPIATVCEPRAAACAGTACSDACNVAHCGAGQDAGVLTCFAASCPGEDPAALHCYGP